MARTLICHPFVPKSTASLIPGQFWSIPLDNGQFACGRVLRLRNSSTRLFVAGLVEWSGDGPPTSDAIANRPLLDCGQVHIKTIDENGGAVLGCRPLEADGIDLWSIRGPFSTWGYGVIKCLAEMHFGDK